MSRIMVHSSGGDEHGETDRCEADGCYPVIECLDSRPTSPCLGPVEYRTPLSATGRSFPRCDKHWAERLDTQERLNARYPDSSVPPEWFDPADAGERWDSDY